MVEDIVERVEFLRLDANRRIDPATRTEFGQFMTPATVARLMASLLQTSTGKVRLLEAGAGVGSLFTAAVSRWCEGKSRPSAIEVVAFELDDHLAGYIPDAFRLCKAKCEQVGIEFTGRLIQDNFITHAVESLAGNLFNEEGLGEFTCTILNPPYRKINSGGVERLMLRRVGIEASNLYAGFVALAIRLLEPDGELVSITPRSFCNGSYFRPFREMFLGVMELRHIRVFESRKNAFRGDDVLQENVIVHAVRQSKNSPRARRKVTITSSAGPDDHLPLVRNLDYTDVVNADDPELFIHISPDEIGQQLVRMMAGLESSLDELGLTVSTGRVVDFRVKEHLRQEPGKNTAPLIWPTHFADGFIEWPKSGSKKPNAIEAVPEIANQLVPSGNYVLVRRFSAKEEKRRVVAAVYEPDGVTCETVAFENHLNYYHCNGGGLDATLARGMTMFLNSTVVDSYFRQFNGHTQVNATDLRSFRYPSEQQLLALGAHVNGEFPGQAEIDNLIGKELDMAADGGTDPVAVRTRIEEALQVLKVLGLPRAQLNERSALTLLALLGMKSDTPWDEASDPLCGITPMMDFFRDHYGKAYKPNTRETVRRQTVHQFLDAGLIVANPDKPERPVNSPKAVYQLESSALSLLRMFGTKTWDRDLKAYQSTVEGLKTKYAQERQMTRIPIAIAPGKEITLSPGGQNVLIKHIVNEFAPRFASPGQMIYLGDTDEKFAFFDKEALTALGVRIEQHGKMPDVVVHYTEKNWLILIEAVTSHGPVDPKRRGELQRLFADSKAGLIFVTAFLTRKAMVQYLDQIAWETEVWVAANPTHMIHFNGTRFLGPY